MTIDSLNNVANKQVTASSENSKFNDKLLAALDLNGDGLVHYGNQADMTDTETYKRYSEFIPEFTFKKYGEKRTYIESKDFTEMAEQYHMQGLAGFIKPSRTYVAMDFTMMTAQTLEEKDKLYFDTAEGNNAYEANTDAFKRGSTDVPILDYFTDDNISVEEAKKLSQPGYDISSEQDRQRLQLEGIIKFFENRNLLDHPDYKRLKPQFDAMQKTIVK